MTKQIVTAKDIMAADGGIVKQAVWEGGFYGENRFLQIQLFVQGF